MLNFKRNKFCFFSSAIVLLNCHLFTLSVFRSYNLQDSSANCSMDRASALASALMPICISISSVSFLLISNIGIAAMQLESFFLLWENAVLTTEKKNSSDGTTTGGFSRFINFNTVLSTSGAGMKLCGGTFTTNEGSYL